MSDIFKKLSAPFPPELISWRVGATDKKKQERLQGSNAKATKGIALAYIDARDVMERLDSVVGPENWQALHPHANGKTSCRIGIKIKEEWIWKENGAGDSAMDAEKGAFSDSFKRSAVLWGVGRYLYDVPNIWVDLDEWGQIKDKDDPRLKRALKDAAQGIRGTHEPEPELKPVTPEEETLITDSLKACKNNDELESEKSRARLAWPRMNKEQQDRVLKIITEMDTKLFQAPPARAA